MGAECRAGERAAARYRPRRPSPPPNRRIGVPPARPPCICGARSRARVGLRGDSLRSHPHAYRAGPLLPGSRRYAWALLLARIYEVFPLRCSLCGVEMRIIAFLTDGPTVRDILDHLGEPTAPPQIAPARGPPLWEATGAAHDPSADPLLQSAPAFEFDQRLAW